MAKTEGKYIQVAYENVFGHISTNFWQFFIIKRLKIREKCAWVRSNTWQDERLVATGLDQFFSVFQFFDKSCDWQPKNFRICATATSGLVFCSWVQFDFGLFFQFSELDLQTLPVTFVQLVRFIAFVSRLHNEVLLVQPGSFQLIGHSQPILPPSIQEFISQTCFIPLPSVNIIWNFLAQMAWTIDLDIIPARGPNFLSIFAEHGHSHGISKIQLYLMVRWNYPCWLFYFL